MLQSRRDQAEARGGSPRLLCSALACIAAAAAVAGCGDDDGDPQPAAPVAIPSDHLVVAAAGDFGLEPHAVATLRSIGNAAPDVVLGLGDFSYAGPGSEGEFCDLVDRTVGPTVPFEVVSGNHEDDTGGDGLIDRFASCLPDRAGAVGDYASQYYFDAGALARFIMIAPDLTIDRDYHHYGPGEDGADTPDLAWLKRTIDDARDRGIRWIVVGMHKNCITTGEYYCDVYQDLFSTLIEKRVDLVLTGHDHTYQRSKQLSAPRPGCAEVVVGEFDPGCVVGSGDTYARGAGTAFVIAGTGGEDLYAVHPDDPEAGYFAAAMGRNSAGARHGFVRLTITPQRLVGRFVGSTPGIFSDHFEIASLARRDPIG